MLKKVIFALLAVILVSGIVSAQGVVVIANNSVPGSGISKGELEQIFMGRMTSWSNGSTIVPVGMKRGDAAQVAFLNDVTGIGVRNYTSHWQQAVFTGEGTPPQTFDTADALVNFVASTPGAIGYVAAGTATGATKVLTVN